MYKYICIYIYTYIHVSDHLVKVLEKMSCSLFARKQLDSRPLEYSSRCAIFFLPRSAGTQPSRPSSASHDSIKTVRPQVKSPG